MTTFILNDTQITTDSASGMTLLDYVRYQKNLTGTKIGCREGDCGACTVLIGEMVDGSMHYRSVTSCVTPLGNAHGKHVVTIEGLNMPTLSPVQSSFIEHSATQCGFCTVGFVMSLTGCCMNKTPLTYENAISSMDGNICRCTGYKSIERAADSVAQLMKSKDETNPLEWLVEQNCIPNYFNDIPKRLSDILTIENISGEVIIGGGTDMYVQRHYETENSNLSFVSHTPELKGISLKDNICTIGAATVVSDLLDSPVIKLLLPSLVNQLKLVSSTPIRNTATIAGNFVNASPIGDLTAIFLALNAELVLRDSQFNERKVLLRNFYKGYKTIDKQTNEVVTKISFLLSGDQCVFNFEKVSKRTYLDIASVNTAVQLRLDGTKIVEAHVSAGGVSPIPLYLNASSHFLAGKELNVETLTQLQTIAQTEISPIGDARGSEEYKRLLLNQLLMAHFITLFPTIFIEEVAL